MKYETRKMISLIVRWMWAALLGTCALLMGFVSVSAIITNHKIVAILCFGWAFVCAHAMVMKFRERLVL